MDVEGSDIHIYADVIQNRLGVSCSALSGANIADEVAIDKFSETTVGYRKREEGEMWQKLFCELFACAQRHRQLTNCSYTELQGQHCRGCELHYSVQI